MLRFGKRIETLNEVISKVCSFLLLLLIFLTFEQVVARYFFSASSMALQELEWHLFAIIFLLGGSVTLHKNEHVRVDVFYHRFSKKIQCGINLVGTLCFLFPVMLVLVYYGVIYVWQAYSYSNPHPEDYWSAQLWERDSVGYSLMAFMEKLLRATLLRGEISPNPGGLEGRALIKWCIPVSALFMLWQGMAYFNEQLSLLRRLASKSGNTDDA